jgi:DnaJ-domain-containing protein 1
MSSITRAAFVMRNPFVVLGVPEDADPQTIRRAYKRLAVQHHPDRSAAPDAAARFKEVTEAYAVLTNERERRRYARRRRQEHAAREAHWREQAAAGRRAADQHSQTAAAAERAFWEYARQVQARRQQSARAQPSRSRAATRGWWGDGTSPALALLLMAIYLWRSAMGLPMQPWLPPEGFATHDLTSPIWITLTLGLLMIVMPRWFLMPLVMDEVKDVRVGGWALFLLCPLMSAVVLKVTVLGAWLPFL